MSYKYYYNDHILFEKEEKEYELGDEIEEDLDERT